MSARQSHTRERVHARIDEEASAWLVIMHDDVVSERALKEFEVWRAADPRHGAAYDALSETWIEASELRHRMRSLADPTSIPPWWRRWFGVGQGRSVWPALVSSGLAASAALAAAFVFLPPMLDRPDAEFVTDVAEMRSVWLSDGTVVTLAPGSNMDVNFSEAERRVTLTEGEAFFEVAHNGDRPFFVDAGTASVRVVGTKFDVRRSERQVSVSVLEGVVHVARDRGVAEETARVLRAGDRIEVLGRDALLAPQPLILPVAQVGAAEAGAWRSGRLTFDGMPLREVAADLSRYYGPGIRVSDEVASLRVTASFRSDEVTTFVEALDGALPVAVEREASGRYVVRAP